ncbi:replication protein A 70 kDa DNA-binding subunit [Striga asiatica]|uniref:Replication protein A 70 kDa DNA-binding subunit n=1 Tax=Striga asiatica TaxID=4170 RepID=A0A5A7Q831_STRAF|nr:replication protein A 70 kDa DNA-binding subunit [Striga asiatica]
MYFFFKGRKLLRAISCFILDDGIFGLIASVCSLVGDTLSIKEIQPHVRRWTALVQVVQKGHVAVSQSYSSISYCRFLFVDAEGTKVSAVAYNNNIRTNAALLVPFKWCYVSGATVKKVDKKYLEYKKLHSFADSDNLQNVLGVVVHSFSSRQIGEDSVAREIILVNEEKIPIMFTLWNDFATTEGSQLTNNIHSANVVLALRVKVTTFNVISLSTRAPSAILINPPMAAADELKQWYSQHKNEIDDMIGRAAYKDTTILLPYPSTDNVLSVHTMLSGVNNVRAAWIKGCVTLPHIQQSLWFSACSSCHKKFDLQTSSAIRCSSCSQNNMIEARARIPLEIADGTGILSAVVYGEDAERLIAYTAQQLQAAEDKGADLVATIRSGICGKNVVCFVRLFQAAGPTYSVVKDEVETQLFTPSTKACLEAILDEPTTMSTPKESKSATVRSLLFENPKTTAESLVATDTHNAPDVHAAYIRTKKKKMSVSPEQGKMNQTMLNRGVQPHQSQWTALIQFVERLPSISDEVDPSIIYQRFVFVDSEGTKVLAVACKESVQATLVQLIPFKWYHIPEAILKKRKQSGSGGNYTFTCVITDSTLIQPLGAIVPDHLPANIEIQEFHALHRFADSDILHNVLGVVVRTFPARQISLNLVARDIVLLNDEYLQNRLQVSHLIFSAAYKDTSILLPRPSPANITTIHTNCMDSGLNSFRSCTTIPLVCSMSKLREKNRTNLSARRRCVYCNQDGRVQPRVRIPVDINDGTGIIPVVVFGSDAERLINYTGQQLKETNKMETTLIAEISSTIHGIRVVCFIRKFQADIPIYSKVLEVTNEINHENDNEDIAEQGEANIEGQQHMVGDANAVVQGPVDAQHKIHPIMAELLFSSTEDEKLFRTCIHQRVYNLPSESEVAALLVDGQGDEEPKMLVQTVKPHVNRWITLVQVLEQRHIMVSERDPSNTWQEFLLVNSEGTQVSAVAYNSDVQACAMLLIPSNEVQRNSVNEYGFTWIITPKKIIQPSEPIVPAHLTVNIEARDFIDLHTFADTKVCHIVAHAFPAKQIGPTLFARDIILVNNERIPILLTLWNKFAQREGNQLANNIDQANVIIAMRVKVTTLNGISLSTRSHSAVLINPPTAEANSLKQWYLQNQSEVAHLVSTKAYRNTSVLLSHPKPGNIVTIRTLLEDKNYLPTAWIQGFIRLSNVQEPLAVSVCLKCENKIEDLPRTETTCIYCNHDGLVQTRLQIPLDITDVTGAISTIVSGNDAEALISGKVEQLRLRNTKGTDFIEKIRSYIYGKSVVCFIQKFQCPVPVYSVFKLYIDEEQIDLQTLDVKNYMNNPSTGSGIELIAEDAEEKKHVAKNQFRTNHPQMDNQAQKEVHMSSTIEPYHSTGLQRSRNSTCFVLPQPQTDIPSASSPSMYQKKDNPVKPFQKPRRNA